MSSFFDRVLKNIFTRNDNPVIGVAVHEVLTRNPREEKAFNAWKLTPAYNQLLEEISHAYYYKKTGIRSDITIHLFQSDYANGFAVSYLPRIGKRHFQYLFDVFKERVTAMSYRTVNADRQIIDKKSYVETREKYYLKPPISLQEVESTVTPSEQLYGNVSVEHVLADNQPQYIKVLVSIYSDRLFTHPLSYDEFIERLLEVKESR